jgi:hypothetical protein
VNQKSVRARARRFRQQPERPRDEEQEHLGGKAIDASVHITT